MITALIALPVFGLSAHAVYRATATVSDAQRLDHQVGDAPAAVMLPSAARELGFDELPNLEAAGTTANASTTLGTVLGTGTGDVSESDLTDESVTAAAPGYAVADPWTSERVAATVGSPVVATRFSTTNLEAGDTEFPVMRALFADANNPLLGSSINLVSGRWPTADNEVVVSQRSVESGTPTAGTLEVRVGRGLPKQTFDVVGVGDASLGRTGYVGDAVAVFALEAAPDEADWRWLVDRDAPMGFDEATDLTTYGLSVISRDIGPADEGYEGDERFSFVIATIRVGMTAAILLLTMLLAAPAFAISATERRRDLALLHAQGASPADLRRHVLAYAALVAGVSTVGAATVGAGGMYLFLKSAVPTDQEWLTRIEMPWLIVALIVVAAFVSAIVAAWLPARRVVRAAALPTARVERTSQMQVATKAVVSAVVLTLGLVALIVGARDEQSSNTLILGIALTTAAGLTGIPAVLAGVGRWSRRGPIAVRMALGDISRHRSRSTPAVAAIAGVVGIMLVFASVVEAGSGLDSRSGFYLPEALTLMAVVTVVGLAATLIVTALATSYNKDASTTLDTIGASTSVRRSFAGSYAATIAGIGAVVGSAFGLAIGWACAWWTITGQQLVENGDPNMAISDFVSVPWAWLAVAIVLPVLAYGLAWITVRPTKTDDHSSPELERTR